MGHKIVAVDESGSFSSEMNSFSGIGAVVADWDDATRATVTAGVSALVTSALPAQLRKGELKGCDLTMAQFAEACEIVSRARAKVCAFAVKSDEHFMDIPRPEFMGMIRACAKRANVVDLGERWVAAAQNCSPEEFVYSQVVLRLFENGVVQVICAGAMPDRVDVVFDPRLVANREEVLHPQVYLAFVNQLRGTLGYNNPGLFGLAESPWQVVQKRAEHESFLTLVDWMIYPFVAVRRLGSKFLNGAAELKDRAEAALEMLNHQKRLGIFKEAKIPRRLLEEFGTA